jgi:hypothetical protein
VKETVTLLMAGDDAHQVNEAQAILQDSYLNNPLHILDHYDDIVPYLETNPHPDMILMVMLNSAHLHVVNAIKAAAPNIPLILIADDGDAGQADSLLPLPLTLEKLAARIVKLGPYSMAIVRRA